MIAPHAIASPRAILWEPQVTPGATRLALSRQRSAERLIDADRSGAERDDGQETAEDRQVLHELHHLHLGLGTLEAPERVEDQRDNDEVDEQAERREPREKADHERDAAE